MNRLSSSRPAPGRATPPGARIVLLVLAIAALGFTIVTMHAMHLGSSHASATQAPNVQVVATHHGVTPTTGTQTSARYDPRQAWQADPAATPAALAIGQAQSVAGHHTGDAGPCASDCLADDPGQGMAMLCLSLLPAAALFTLLRLRRRDPSTIRLQTPRLAIGSVLGHRGPPRPRPTLAALCVLRV